MRRRRQRPVRWGLVTAAIFWMVVVLPLSAVAAPYAAMVMDARTGEVLHSRNADTRLHPASLTKMMTLYIVFEAVENGEIGLDTPVTISRNATREPPSKLGLRAGQRIKLRYLIRAAAVKSANDAAAALAEAIEGSVPRFAQRMNRTAKAMGMTRTTFKNPHGLTRAGHLSTARDMTILGRHVFYDYPQYYNLFSRITADAGIRKVYHTNRKLLRSYRGADGIKTGYTSAAGFNLVASAERGGKRIMATVFGGRSTASRNAKVAELLDLGFRRAPTRVALNKPARPPYLGKMGGTPTRFAKWRQPETAAAVTRSLRPRSRPVAAPPAAPVVVAKADIDAAVKAVQAVSDGRSDDDAMPAVTPVARPEDLIMAKARGEAQAEAPPAAPEPEPEPTVIERISTSSGLNWGVTLGRYPSQYQARKVLLRVALNEMTTLDGSLRKVLERDNGYEANFMGLSRRNAELACRRLQAKQITCLMIEPSG